MNRKQLTNDQGADLSKALQYNYHLEKLCLEGNQLGPKFLESLAEMLRINKHLRYIDLEGNPLTNGNNESGIDALFNSLKSNDTLMHLNLNNTGLTETSGNAILYALKANKKIIMLDIEKNPKIRLDTVREIQKQLLENNKIWRAIRKKEWQERKIMINEEENTKKINKMREEEVDTIKRILREARMDQLKREELWIKAMKERDEDRAKREKKIEKEADARAKKKKRRGKRKNKS